MRSAIKKYNTNYKKKVDVHRDSYLPRLAPKENAAAAAPFIIGAGGLSRRPVGIAIRVHTHPIFCPACEKMKQHAAGGELHLSGVGKAERGEVLRVLRNEEERAREKNPLGRIMRMEADGEHWKVETTRKSWRSG